jgi:hypothetical protein
MRGRYLGVDAERRESSFAPAGRCPAAIGEGAWGGGTAARAFVRAAERCGINKIALPASNDYVAGRSAVWNNGDPFPWNGEWGDAYSFHGFGLRRKRLARGCALGRETAATGANALTTAVGSSRGGCRD